MVSCSSNYSNFLKNDPKTWQFVDNVFDLLLVASEQKEDVFQIVTSDQTKVNGFNLSFWWFSNYSSGGGSCMLSGALDNSESQKIWCRSCMNDKGNTRKQRQLDDKVVVMPV